MTAGTHEGSGFAFPHWKIRLRIARSQSVDGLETSVDKLETRVDGFETHVDELETHLDGFETSVIFGSGACCRFARLRRKPSKSGLAGRRASRGTSATASLLESGRPERKEFSHPTRPEKRARRPISTADENAGNRLSPRSVSPESDRRSDDPTSRDATSDRSVRANEQLAPSPRNHVRSVTHGTEAPSCHVRKRPDGMVLGLPKGTKFRCRESGAPDKCFPSPL